MSASKQHITRETFQGADSESRQMMLFDLINELYHISCAQREFCEQRRQECEQKFATTRNSKKDRIFMVLGGIIGGLIFWASVISIKLGF